jgi:hypothetical protein
VEKLTSRLINFIKLSTGELIISDKKIQVCLKMGQICRDFTEHLR